MVEYERSVNHWFGGLVMDSSHKDWTSPRRFYSAKKFGRADKQGRAAYGRAMARCMVRIRRFKGHDIYA